jgi:hypothetical protein
MCAPVETEIYAHGGEALEKGRGLRNVIEYEVTNKFST